MKLSTRDIAIAGVLSAIAVLLAVTQVGYIPFFAGVSITVLHVPVIIGAIIAGPTVGTLIGLIFGVSSLVLAAVTPRSPADVFFTDPLVSVVPRLFIGVAAWGVYRLIRHSGRNWALLLGAVALIGVDLGVAWTIYQAEWALAPALAVLVLLIGVGALIYLARRATQAQTEELALSVAAIVGTLTNTVLVLSALVLRAYLPAGVAVTVGVANGPAEMAAAVVLTVAIVAGWRQVALRPHRASV